MCEGHRWLSRCDITLLSRLVGKLDSTLERMKASVDDQLMTLLLTNRRRGEEKITDTTFADGGEASLQDC